MQHVVFIRFIVILVEVRKRVIFKVLTVTIRTGSGEPMTPKSAIIAPIATSYSLYRAVSSEDVRSGDLRPSDPDLY